MQPKLALDLVVQPQGAVVGDLELDRRQSGAVLEDLARRKADLMQPAAHQPLGPSWWRSEVDQPGRIGVGHRHAEPIGCQGRRVQAWAAMSGSTPGSSSQ